MFSMFYVIWSNLTKGNWTEEQMDKKRISLPTKKGCGSLMWAFVYFLKNYSFKQALNHDKVSFRSGKIVRDHFVLLRKKTSPELLDD